MNPQEITDRLLQIFSGINVRKGVLPTTYIVEGNTHTPNNADPWFEEQQEIFSDISLQLAPFYDEVLQLMGDIASSDDTVVLVQFVHDILFSPNGTTSLLGVIRQYPPFETILRKIDSVRDDPETAGIIAESHKRYVQD